MIDKLRRHRADLARQIEALDRVANFVDALSAECGIAAEVETDDGDVIVCIPQIMPRETLVVRETPVGDRQDPSPSMDDTQEAPIFVPIKRAPKGATGARSRAGKPWDPAEDAEIVRRRAAGEAIGVIAHAIGRTYAATDERARKVLADRIEAAKSAHCADAHRSKPDQKGASHADREPLSLREIQAHLNALGHVAPWTPDLDHRLVAGLMSGRKLPDVAKACGVMKEQALARWRALMPDLGGQAQQTTLAELAARASVADAAE